MKVSDLTNLPEILANVKMGENYDDNVKLRVAAFCSASLKRSIGQALPSTAP